jgi:hypothetical protein
MATKKKAKATATKNWKPHGRPRIVDMGKPLPPRKKLEGLKEGAAIEALILAADTHDGTVIGKTFGAIFRKFRGHFLRGEVTVDEKGDVAIEEVVATYKSVGRKPS